MKKLALLIALVLFVLPFSALAEEAYNPIGDEYTVLVNHDYMLDKKYVPDDLVKVDVKFKDAKIELRKEAADALLQLFADAKEAGYNLIAASGYRSYSRQATIYYNKVKSMGKERAAKLSAPAGASEHQLGLAVDITCKANKQYLNANFAKTDEGKWVTEHCYDYGFILRYKQEWEDVTGYAYEPWHIRYVGMEHAANIKELDIPYEEYVELYLGTVTATEDDE
ncbi:MAG: M15 family metallopeptidase [Eubacteriales bacterium]|nr:M15 family metallopeptidase [Eubacteriales bacterium]MDD3881217.1 M15 family metallopeptidase [Eubacteriales bacterium]MDD4512135.1 M15 family metallopeptidase [Eubacteriales bacterium]